MFYPATHAVAYNFHEINYAEHLMLATRYPLLATRYFGHPPHTNFNFRAANQTIRSNNTPCRQRWMFVVP